MEHRDNIPGFSTTVFFTVVIAVLAIAGLGIMFFMPDTQLSVERTGDYSVKDDVINADTQFSIRLPEQVSEKNISVSELKDAPYRGFEVKIDGFSETDLLEHPLSGSLDAIEDVVYSGMGKEASFRITTEDIREISYEIHDGRLDIMLRTPAEIYDHVIVIDAGAGGDDPGVVSGEDTEKDITLAIVNKLKPMLDQLDDTKVFYTRLSDETVPKAARISFANEIGADLFLSVSLSSTASGRISDISGVSAYYDPEVTGSMEFAQVVQSDLLEATGALDKGVMRLDDDVIITLAKIPAVVVKCGYITNEAELSSLKSDTYTEAIANALYKSITSTLKE